MISLPCTGSVHVKTRGNKNIFCRHYCLTEFAFNVIPTFYIIRQPRQRCVMGVGLCASMPSLYKRKISGAKMQLYYKVIIRIYLTSVPDPG